MYADKQISDKELLKIVNRRLQRGGGSAVKADVQRGTVTLSGTLRYPSQRIPLIKIVSAIAGVRSVVDQLKMVARH